MTKTNKLNLVREALAAVGPKATPTELREWIIKHKHYVLATKLVANYKYKIATGAAMGPPVDRPRLAAAGASTNGTGHKPLATPTLVPAAHTGVNRITLPASLAPQETPNLTRSGGVDNSRTSYDLAEVLNDIAAVKAVIDKVGFTNVQQIMSHLATETLGNLASK
jgi:hypothetical protein